MLAALILIPLAAAPLAWLAGRRSAQWAQGLAFAALGLSLAVVGLLWTGDDWATEIRWTWVPRFGIGFHLVLDGLSLLMVALTAFLGLMAVAVSTEVRRDPGFYFFNLLLTVAGVFGVFLAWDLFLFFFFWEAMLVPMYFLIAVWGYEERRRAAIKFFIFTQASGLLMLASIVALALLAAAKSGQLSFDYRHLLDSGPRESPLLSAGGLVMLGFFIAFAVKVPVVPLHTWLPDAHTQAPTAASVLLAGVLLKTGGYGLLRFVVPLFPAAAGEFAPYAMALGVLGILYGAVLAAGQDDLKRLVAYTSVSHMGFVLLAVFAWTGPALQGAVVQMLAHGLSTGALFMVVGAIQTRLHSRNLDAMGGLWARIPRIAAFGMFFAIASLGLPGLGNFVGEFLILLGAWPVNPLLAALAALGLVAATVYALLAVQRAFHGPASAGAGLPDYRAGDVLTVGVMAVGLVFIGLYPAPVLEAFAPVLGRLQEVTAGGMP